MGNPVGGHDMDQVGGSTGIHAVTSLDQTLTAPVSKSGWAYLAGDVVPQEASVHDRWWVKCGLWAIDTYNCNAWTPGLRKYMVPSQADIALLQETKLLPNALSFATSAARKAGWSCIHAQAWRTAADKASGGVSVAARRGIGICPASQNIVDDAYRHRINVSWINAVAPGGIYIVSVYLRTAEGLSPENLMLLEKIAVAVKCLRGAWIIAGDWNLDPYELGQTNFQQVIRGRIVTTTTPTCNGNKYDFFVVDECIANSVVAVQRISDVAPAPHYAVRLLIRGIPARSMVRRLCKPTRVPPILPHGPSSRPPCYDQVIAHCRDSAAAIDEAALKWYSLARMEWNDLTGGCTRSEAAKFVWQPAVMKRAADQPGGDRLSNAWQSMASHCREAARIMGKSVNRDDTDVKLLAVALRSALKVHWKLPRRIRDLNSACLHRHASSLLLAVQRSSVSWALALAKAACKQADKIIIANARKRTAEWRAKLCAQAPKLGHAATPSSAAFRWIRDYAGWRRSQVGPDTLHDAAPDENDSGHIEYEDKLLIDYSRRRVGALVPLSDQACVDLECNKWADLWQTEAEYRSPEFGTLQEEPLHLLSTWALKQAALSFPPGTGLGADNVAPRALTRLSDAALIALALLFRALETLGTWTAAFNLVLIVLLPKSDGGLRPIGLFPTIIRIWMRARVSIARQWESTHALPGVYGGTGMGAHRAAWNESFSAELAAHVKADHIQALLDLVKCFETVPHAELVHAARARGVSLILLRLSISAYRLARALGIEGVFSRCVIATRSITAGSGFATTELRVLLFDLILEVQQRWSPTLMTTTFVDDLTLSASGTPVVIVKLMLRALTFVMHVLQERLKMQVSTKKSLALSGRPTLSKALCKALGSCNITHSRAAKLLGADNAAGRRRSTRVARTRVAKVKRSIGKYRQMRRQGIKTRVLARAAATTSITYAADAMGTSDAVLNTMRMTTAHAIAAPTGGKNPDLILFSSDLHTGTADPAFMVHQLPVKHWALAWWEGWQSPPRLRAAFVAARAKLLRARGSPWQRATGATAGYILTLERLNWQPHAEYAVDDIGRTWCFISDPPAAIMIGVRDSVRRWRARRIASLIPGLLPDEPDVDTGERFMVHLVAAPLGSLLHHNRAAHRLRWSHKWNAPLQSAICGGQWPQIRRAKLRNFELDDTRCQLCFNAQGTLQHRLECEKVVPSGGWQAMPTVARHANSRISGSRLLALSTRGLLIANLPIPAETDDWFEWLLEPDHRIDTDNCLWFTDGSLVDPLFAPFVSCGFAVIVLTKKGTLVGIGHGAPPSWVRTAAGSEAWALSFVVSTAAVVPTIFTDCLGLLHTVTAGVSTAIGADRVQARIWKLIAHHVDGDFSALLNQLIWLPAHKTLDQALQSCMSNGRPVTNMHWRANRLADMVAKGAAARGKHDWSIIRFLESARALVHYKAVTLAEATCVANNCPINQVTESGTERVVFARDAIGKPAREQREATYSSAPSGKQSAPSVFSLAHLASQAERLRAQSQADSSIAKDVNTRTSSAPAAARFVFPARNQVGVNCLEDIYPARNRGGVNRLDDQLEDSMVRQQTMFTDTDTDALIDRSREQEAIRLLPREQRFSLSTDSERPVNMARNKHSGDAQCIARRAATAQKHAAKKQVAAQVETIGARLTAGSSGDSVAGQTATSRLEQLRARIRAKEAHNAA